MSTEHHAAEWTLPRRRLGRDGPEISLLGLGGFHQLEVDEETVASLVSRYLAAGGNYIETARGYGRGASERKLGFALAGHDRDRLVLASKTGAGTADDVRRDLERSLEALGTDVLDLYFFHGVNGPEALDAICAPGGALEGFQRAKDEGLVRGFGVSSHWPPTYVEAARRLPLQAALIWGNYLDFCNFPEIPNEVLPALRAHGVGILFMKPVADGFLYRSVDLAFGYALGWDPDGIVAGFNTRTMLDADLAAIRRFHGAPSDREAVLRDAIELGTYVCRQCATCSVLPGAGGERLKRLFELEGKVDRQMDDGQVEDTAQFALRERLKGWFHSADRARACYAALPAEARAFPEADFRPCLYGLDVPSKIARARRKLAPPGA